MAVSTRTLVLIAYTAALGIAFAIDILDPWAQTYVVYGVLFLFVASFFLFRPNVLGRPGSGGPSPSAGPLPGGSPIVPSTPPVQLAFCHFCGSDLPNGASSCPVCRRTVRPI